MAKIPSEIIRILPPDAKLVKKTTTKLGTTYVFQHTLRSYIVDGDRIVIKLKRGTSATIVERIWAEDITPPPAPIKKPERKAVPVLINPDDPFYVWEEGNKPAPRTPCFVVQKKADLKILDMDGKVIGKGLPPP